MAARGQGTMTDDGREVVETFLSRANDGLQVVMRLSGGFLAPRFCRANGSMVAATDWPALNQPGPSKAQLGSHPSISFSYLKLKLVEQPLTYFIAPWPNSLFFSLCNMAGLVGYASSDEDDDTSPHAPSPKVYFMSNLV